MVETAVQFSLNAEIPGPLDSKNHGDTAGRPTGIPLYVGLLYYDTDLGSLIVCSEKAGENGATEDVWVDAGTKVGSTSGGAGLDAYLKKDGTVAMTDTLSTPGVTLTAADADSKVLSNYGDADLVPKYAVNQAISDLVGGADAALNTLKEIGDELKDPANSTVTTILDSIGTSGSIPTAISAIKNNPGAQLKVNTLLAKYKDPNGVEQTHVTSDYVQNPMGRITTAAGGDFTGNDEVTIADLRTKYGTLDHLISAMLKVAAVPPTNPQARGAVLTLSGQGTTLIDLGTEISRTFKLELNRGYWDPLASTHESGSPTSSTVYPYGMMSAGSLTFDGQVRPVSLYYGLRPNGTYENKAKPFGTVTVTFTPVNMTSMSTSNITATSVAGEQVRNNYGQVVAGTPFAEKSDWTAGNVTYTIQAPVYVGATATTTTANGLVTFKQATGVNATVNMQMSTGVAYVPRHVYTDYVRFPREPTAVYQWNATATKFDVVVPTSGEGAWNVSSGDQQVGSATITYYTWQNTVIREPADLKFTF